MVHIKRLYEFAGDTLNPSELSIGEISSIFEDGIKKGAWWESIKEKEFSDIPLLSKEDFGFKVDIMVDGTMEYKANKHEPCIYFRNGNGEMDFLPMVICTKPYVPYPFVQNITDDELLWTYEFVRKNHNVLLKRANDKIGATELFKYISEGVEHASINEGETKLGTSDTGLTRFVWIGPYDKSQHYLRIKTQTPNSSTISKEWASLSIPDLKIAKGRGEYDLSEKEERAAKKFAIMNKEILDDFANSKIKYKELGEGLIKVNKKGEADVRGKGNIEYVNEKDGKHGFIIVKNVKDHKGKFGAKNKDGALVTKDWFDEIVEFHKMTSKGKNGKREIFFAADAVLNKRKCKLYGD